MNIEKKHCCFLPTRFSRCVVALAVGPVAAGLALLYMAQVNAAAPPEDAPAAVTPIDTELDRQNKLRLQQKILRELEENQRRVLEYKKEKGDKGGAALSSEPEKNSSERSD